MRHFYSQRPWASVIFRPDFVIRLRMVHGSSAILYHLGHRQNVFQCSFRSWYRFWRRFTTQLNGTTITFTCRSSFSWVSVSSVLKHHLIFCHWVSSVEGYKVSIKDAVWISMIWQDSAEYAFKIGKVEQLSNWTFWWISNYKDTGCRTRCCPF